MLLETFYYLYLLFISKTYAGINNNGIEQCNLNSKLREEILGYQPVANRIIEAVINGEFKGSTYNRLAEFVDTFGNRLSGTENLENAIDYMVNKSIEAELENVHTEDVQVPYWIRGKESAQLLKPRKQYLRMLGLGTTIGTPKEGITAGVLVVNSFEELKKIGHKAVNKIVVFNEEWVGYGKTVIYRGRAASEAAKVGAVAALVRSVTPFSLDLPHTGMQRYEAGVKQIPVACITPADANMLERMQKRGSRLELELKMEARNDGQRLSRNTVAEIVGSKNPEKVVIVSGHLDSWDVGQGAMDDGAGAFLSWNTLAVLKSLGLKPKRTVRVILWTGEEFGYVGARKYFQDHKHEIDKLNFVMESDMGTFTPRGLEVSGTPEAACIVQEILNLLTSINTTSLRQPQDGGPDIEMWTDIGVPGASPWTDNQKYFWYHHTGADTMDVENPKDLDLLTALWATVSYVIADLSVDIPKHLVPPKENK